MRWVALLVLASCNSLLGVHDFGGDAGSDVGGDAPPVPVDVVPLVDAAAVCAITSTGPTTAQGSIGAANIGKSTPPLACPTGEVPVGFRFDMSAEPPPEWLQPSVETVAMRCGTVSRLTSGAYATVLGTTATATSTGSCAGWPATTTGTEVDCPSGMVLVGIDANEDMSSSTGQLGYVNSLVAVCAPLDSAGHANPTIATMIAYPDTGTNANLPQTVACQTGSIVMQLAPRGDCGIAELTFGCAPTACQ